MHTLLDSLGLSRINQGVYSAGVWSETQGPLLASINPTTEEALGQVHCVTPKEIPLLIAEAKKAQKEWQKKPMPVRGELIRQLGEAFRAHKSSLGALISLEMGKSLREGEGEVQEMIDMADYVTGLSRYIGGQVFPSERAQHHLQEQWHPLGVVTVITAFNFPMAVWAWNALLGAVCGNAIIWKPSHKVPLCALAVTKLVNTVMEKAGFPGVFSLCISDNNDVVSPLIESHDVALVSFTGSCAAGKYVHETVSHRLGRTLLELGGNNAVIVEQSASLALAIPGIVFGAIGTSGQRCTTTRRVFIHQSRFQEVSSKLVQAYQQVKKGDPLDLKNHMGPLVDRQAVQLFESTIERIKKYQGKILTGGEVISGQGYFVEPTIVIADPAWDIVNEENFVPILYLMPYESLSQAIELNNQVSQGLSSALFTNDLGQAYYFLSAAGSDCGIVNINVGTSGAEIGAAFGGEKETGQGREAGSDAWKSYMRRQTATINWGDKLPLAQGIKFEV